MRLFALLAVLAALRAASAAPDTTTTDRAPDGVPATGPQADLWKDPHFQKRFLGSYGVRAEVEPRVTTLERQQMEKVLPLLSSDPEAAARQIEKITKPESSAVFDFTLGNLAFQGGDLDKAAAHYRAALEKFPSFLRAHKNLGLILVRQGRYADAIEPLSRAIELGGGDGLAYGLLGYAYASTGKFVPAESAYRSAVLLEPDVVDWKLGLAQSVLQQRKYGEAVSLLDELVARHPDRPDFLLLQANAFIGLDKPMEAAKNYEILLRMGKATPASLYNLGDIYVNEGLWDLAVRSYRLALEAGDGGDVSRILRSAEGLAQRGALEQAGDLLERVEGTQGNALDADQRKQLLEIRARLAVASGNGDEAVPVLEKVVSMDPLDGDALLLLGRHYASSGDPDRAAFYYERAEGIEAFEPEARVRHAQLLVQQSRYKDAVPLLERAQEIRPRDDVGRYLDEVRRVARSTR